MFIIWFTHKGSILNIVDWVKNGIFSSLKLCYTVFFWTTWKMVDKYGFQDEREALLPTYSQNIDVEVLKLELKWQTKI